MGDKRDLFYPAGDSIAETVIAKDGGGTVIDLTGLVGAAISMNLYPQRGGTALFEKTIGDGITIDVDPTTGQFTTNTDTADTKDLRPGYYWLEIIVTVGAITYQVLQGQVQIGRVASSVEANPQPEEGGGTIQSNP